MPSVYCGSGGVTAGSTVRNCSAGVFLYLCGESAGGESVWKVNGNLGVVWSYDVGATCHYVAVADDGSVYVAHDKNGSGHVVTKLDSVGQLVWGHTPAGFVNKAVFVAVHTDGTSRYSEASTVYALDANGGADWSVGSGLSIQGGSSVPVGIDSLGNTFAGANLRGSVSHVLNLDRICKISPTGTHLGYGANFYQYSTAGTDLLVRNDRVYLVGSRSRAAAVGGVVQDMPFWDSSTFDVGVSGYVAYPNDVQQRRAAHGINTGGEFFGSLGDATPLDSLSAFFTMGWDGSTRHIGTNTSYGCAGVGGLGGGEPVYAAVENANDQHFGAVASELKNVFKHNVVSGQHVLIDSARIGSGLLYHMVASAAG